MAVPVISSTSQQPSKGQYSASSGLDSTSSLTEQPLEEEEEGGSLAERSMEEETAAVLELTVEVEGVTPSTETASASEAAAAKAKATPEPSSESTTEEEAAEPAPPRRAISSETVWLANAEERDDTSVDDEVYAHAQADIEASGRTDVKEPLPTKPSKASPQDDNLDYTNTEEEKEQSADGPNNDNKNTKADSDTEGNKHDVETGSPSQSFRQTGQSVRSFDLSVSLRDGDEEKSLSGHSDGKKSKELGGHSSKIFTAALAALSLGASSRDSADDLPPKPKKPKKKKDPKPSKKKAPRRQSFVSSGEVFARRIIDPDLHHHRNSYTHNQLDQSQRQHNQIDQSQRHPHNEIDQSQRHYNQAKDQHLPNQYSQEDPSVEDDMPEASTRSSGRGLNSPPHFLDSDLESDSEIELTRRSSSRQSMGDGSTRTKLSVEDIEICQRLDDEFERALEEREIGYNARYSSVRQSAFLSVFFLLAFLFLGTLFFMKQAHWSIPDSLLFSIYTVTTVGYGRENIPTSEGFQAYVIFYILVGIAALTIMVAQVYQCIALEATRAQHARDKTEMARRGLDILVSAQRGSFRGMDGNAPAHTTGDEILAYHQGHLPGMVDRVFRCSERAKDFFKNHEIGRGLSVLFPFAGLILIGAAVVGPLEGWGTVESIYFAIVSLTTVGYGDYQPTNIASIAFCIFWLPCSIGFMSLFLGNVAAFYIRLSDRNIRRIERQMRRRLQRAKDKAELERAEILSRAYRGQEDEIEAAAATIDKPSSSSNREHAPSSIPVHHAQSIAQRQKKQSGFETLPTSDADGSDIESENNSLFGSSTSDMGSKRRQRIIENSNLSSKKIRSDGRTMQSMLDVVRAVRRAAQVQGSSENSAIDGNPESQFMSIRSTQPIRSSMGHRRNHKRKPSFGLRVLVQERFAEIIATDIAGFQSSIEIKENTLSVTIDSLKETADKWLIPRRARKAFRAVSFEVLYFVGEHGLITRGADALFDLSPFEFHGLFSPVVAAMGDAETMEGWLASTDILADVDLRRDGSRPGLSFFTGDQKQQAPKRGLTARHQDKLRRVASARSLNELGDANLSLPGAVAFQVSDD